MKTLEEWIAEAESSSVNQLGPYGNVFLRPMYFSTIGSRVVGHKHNYDHLTILLTGAFLARSWDLDEDGKEVLRAEKSFRAPQYLMIKTQRWHEFVALEAGTNAVCVFALRNAQGEVTNVDALDFSMACAE